MVLQNSEVKTEDEWFMRSKQAMNRGPARITRKKEEIQKVQSDWPNADEERAGEMCQIVRMHSRQHCTVSFLDERGEPQDDTYKLPLRIVRQDPDEVRRYHLGCDAENMQIFLESVEAGRVDIFDVLAVAPDILEPNCWIKALVIMFIHIVVPVIVIAASLTQVLHPNGTSTWNWQGLCNPKEAWSNPQFLLKLANKVTSVAILMYTYNYITKLKWDLDERPMIDLLHSELCCKRLKKPIWAIFGLLSNSISLAVCGVATIVVIFVSESVLDIVLNATAIFFIINLDEEILEVIDLDTFKDRIQQQVDALNQPTSNEEQGFGASETTPLFRPRNRWLWFERVWALCLSILFLVRLFVAVAIPSVAICKV